MSIFIFIVAEIVGFIFMLAAWKGVFGLIPAFFAMVVMIVLSFHVLARDPKPDGTSVRIASVSAVLWYAVILCVKLALENRSWAITVAAVGLALLTSAIAIFATYSVIERPLQYDVEEAD